MFVIGEEQIKLDDFYNLIFNKEQISLSQKAIDRVIKSFNFLKEFSKGKIIYGINTGLGPMAQFKIDEKDQKELQYNLIRSHCSGCGEKIPDIYVKSAMIARLNTLAMGYSGVHADAIYLLKELINKNIFPYIPEHGGVGASGDLVQLAHIALTLIGEGEVSFKGKLHNTSTVFQKNKLNPISIHIREGLSLINGTSVMTGIGIVNLIHSKNLLSWSILASSMLNEIVESYDDHFSTELNSVKLHEGQNSVSKIMQKLLSDSKLIKQRPEHLYNNNHSSKVVLKHKVQEYYSLRCVPQILGPVLDTILNAEKIIINEVNSVNDNPIIDEKHNNIYHGGNFHGDYVSLEMDKVKIAITRLSMLSERQLNYLLNNKLNDILPPFVNLGKLGLNLGMQGVQFTSTSTVAENQTLSFPMYIHSIPNNNDNQDIVSMGTNSAMLTKRVIDNTYQVIAIEMLTILQAIDYLGFEDKLSDFSKSIFQNLRKIVQRSVNDTVKYKDIDNIKKYIIESRINLI